jgi:ribose 5-phosphate isomerase A
LHVRCVPTSSRVAALARSHGLALEELGSEPLDLAIDGADEVDPRLRLVKGAGGALVRERIVAAAARRFLVLVDATKLVRRLGERMPLPVEIQQFGAERTRRAIEARLGHAVLRGGLSAPVVSDNGGYLLDCRLPATDDLAGLSASLRAIPGVVDTGLFLDLNPEVLVARDGKVEALTPNGF